jgi:pre-mRNA-processing factor SLU7
MSHKTKDCLQRKRKLGAKWTGRDIAADEVIKDVKLGWDAKRDRWNGFEAGEYQEVVDDFNALEELKRATLNKKNGDNDNDSDDEANPNAADEGAKYDAETDMGRKQATSTRNLRLREDTAKYLINLDLDSAKYDPKTRSMVLPADGDPTKILPGDDDGFYSKTGGDAGDFERAQQYAWETQERGGGGVDKIHIQANPTEALLLRKRKAEDDLVRQEKHKKALTEKYGSQEAITGIKAIRPGGGGNSTTTTATSSSGQLIDSNEHFIEYDPQGRIKAPPGAAQKKEKSIYPEDILINNHTAVWGSWWRNFQWGYACCHSVLKNSFCTGEAGREAVSAAEKFGQGGLEVEAEGKHGRDGEEEESGGADGKRRGRRAKVISEAEEEEKREFQDEESRKHAQALRNAGISEAEMEKYRRERVDRNDPMAGMVGEAGDTLR